MIFFSPLVLQICNSFKSNLCLPSNNQSRVRSAPLKPGLTVPPRLLPVCALGYTFCFHGPPRNHPQASVPDRRHELHLPRLLRSHPAALCERPRHSHRTNFRHTRHRRPSIGCHPVGRGLKRALEQGANGTGKRRRLPRQQRRNQREGQLD